MSKKLLFQKTPPVDYGDDMVFEVFVTNTARTINLPIDSFSGSTYILSDCVVDWGDGTAPQPFRGSRPSRKYALIGTYIVKCSGVIPALNSFKMVSEVANWTKLNVINWGNTGLRSLFNMCRCLDVRKVAPLTTGNMELLSDVRQMFTVGTTADGGSAITSIPSDMFRNAKNIVKFDNCFAYNTLLTGKTPTDEDGGQIWERAGKMGYPTSISSTKCFFDCKGLTNYESIPTTWK